MGERAHLASPDVDLETHVTDVVNLVEFEDLREVVLVGHSYAGSSSRTSPTGYPGASPCSPTWTPVPDGVADLDTQSPEVRTLSERRVAEEGDGWRLPIPSWEELADVNGTSLEGLDGDRLRLVRSRAVDQPFGTYTRPLRLTKPAREALPKLLIACSFPLGQVREMIAGGHRWFRKLAGPEWSLAELPTGHWPMFSRP